LPARKATRLTRDEIDPSKALGAVGDPGAGAVVMFLGTVRDHSEAGGVERIEYEAYAPMAEKSLAKTEQEVKRRWPATKAVKIIHRVGLLSVGEVSVAVVISSPHRAEAFEACRYAIEAIKHDAPIWKREKLADGRDVWVEGIAIGPARGGARRTSSRRMPRQKGQPRSGP